MLTETAGWAVEAGGETLCTGRMVPSPGCPASSRSRRRFPRGYLPEELFHGTALPSRFQADLAHSRQSLDDMVPQYNPFQYRCTSIGSDHMANDRVGVSRRCEIIYPIGSHPDFGFELGYWILRYTMLFQDGESVVWPNVVSMDFIDGQAGWWLLDLGSRLYRIEARRMVVAVGARSRPLPGPGSSTSSA